MCRHEERHKGVKSQLFFRWEGGEGKAMKKPTLRVTKWLADIPIEALHTLPCGIAEGAGD